MMRFLFTMMGVIIGLSVFLGLLRSSPQTALIVVGVVVVILMLRSPSAWPGLTRVVVLLLAFWGLVYGCSQAVDKAKSQGKQGSDLVWELLKELPKILFDKVFGTGPAIVRESTEQLKDAQEEIQLAEKICKTAPFVYRAMGDEILVNAYCGDYDAGVFKRLQKDLEALRRGVTGPFYPFIVGGNPSVLNSERYLACLTSKTTRQSALECSRLPDARTIQGRRLCLELAVQIPHDQLGSHNALAPEINQCRGSVGLRH